MLTHSQRALIVLKWMPRFLLRHAMPVLTGWAFRLKRLASSVAVIFSLFILPLAAQTADSPLPDAEFMDQFRKATTAYPIGAEIRADAKIVSRDNFDLLVQSAPERIALLARKMSILQADLDAISQASARFVSRRWLTSLRIYVDPRLIRRQELTLLLAKVSSLSGLDISLQSEQPTKTPNVFINAFGYMQTTTSGTRYFPSKDVRSENIQPKTVEHFFCNEPFSLPLQQYTKCIRPVMFMANFLEWYAGTDFWKDAVIFTPDFSPMVDGFFAAKGKKIYIASCFVPLADDQRVRKLLVKECLLRTLGFPRGIDGKVSSALNPGIAIRSIRSFPMRHPTRVLKPSPVTAAQSDDLATLSLFDERIVRYLYRKE